MQLVILIYKPVILETSFDTRVIKMDLYLVIACLYHLIAFSDPNSIKDVDEWLNFKYDILGHSYIVMIMSVIVINLLLMFYQNMSICL